MAAADSGVNKGLSQFDPLATVSQYLATKCAGDFDRFHRVTWRIVSASRDIIFHVWQFPDVSHYPLHEKLLWIRGMSWLYIWTVSKLLSIDGLNSQTICSLICPVLALPTITCQRRRFVRTWHTCHSINRDRNLDSLLVDRQRVLSHCSYPERSNWLRAQLVIRFCWDSDGGGHFKRGWSVNVNKIVYSELLFRSYQAIEDRLVPSLRLFDVLVG